MDLGTCLEFRICTVKVKGTVRFPDSICADPEEANDEPPRPMSLEIGNVPEKTDILVIGSGFGGSVVAERLAEDGRHSVCLLERGKAYPPGSFPRTPSALGLNFWDPSEGKQGMFDVWSFKGIGAIVSSGLGGGSLIYANVMLRKDESWFYQHDPYHRGQLERWCFGRDDLDPHYDVVKSFLEVQTLPPELAVPRRGPSSSLQRV